MNLFINNFLNQEVRLGPKTESNKAIFFQKFWKSVFVYFNMLKKYKITGINVTRNYN